MSRWTWQVLIIWGYRKGAHERVCCNDKKLRSSDSQCDAAQNPLRESWNCVSSQAVSVCAKRSPATLVITLLGYETPNVLLVWKWDFIFWRKKKKRKKERKEKSGKQSVPGAFPRHWRHRDDITSSLSELSSFVQVPKPCHHHRCSPEMKIAPSLNIQQWESSTAFKRIREPRKTP